MRKLIMTIILAACFSFALLPVDTSANNTVSSGRCGTNLTWALTEDGTLTIRGTGRMYDYRINAAPWCSERNMISGIAIESGVTYIGEYAFDTCRAAENVSISQTVTEIGKSSFAYSGISSLVIPNGVKTIGNSAFMSCDNLTSIIIPESVQYIGDETFGRCRNLKSITVSPENKSFKSIGGVLFDHDLKKIICYPCGKTGKYIIPDGVQIIGDEAFSHGNLSNVILPDSVTTIGDDAFSYSEIEKISIPNSVTAIGEHAFGACYSLRSVEMPLRLDFLGESAFSYCTQLSSFVIPDGITVLGDFPGLSGMFEYCIRLYSVTIPDSVTRISWDTFKDCEQLTDVYFLGSEEEWNQIYEEYLEEYEEYYEPYLDDPDYDEIYISPALETANVHFSASPVVGPDDGKIIFHNTTKGNAVNLLYSKTITISAEILNGGSLKESDITWRNSNQSAVKVADTAFFTEGNTAYAGITLKCIGTGNSEVELRISDGRNGKVAVVGYKPSTSGVFVSTAYGESGSISARRYHTIQLNATVYPAEVIYPIVKWSSNNSSVAAVDQTGKVNLKGKGTAVISAESGGKTGKISITVNENILDYSDYTYQFSNSRPSFRYGSDYKIPVERYIQAGASEAVANMIFNSPSGKWSGNCYGMSMSSMLFYMRDMHAEKYSELEFHAPRYLDSPTTDGKWDTKLRNMLELLQVSQPSFGYNNIVNEYSFFRNIQNIIRELDEGNPVMFGVKLYKKNGDYAGGHSIVIYGYTKNGNSTRFNIYDCSGFVDHLTLDDNNNASFLPYKKYVYDVFPLDVSIYNELISEYNYLVRQNYNNANTLLKKSGKSAVEKRLTMVTPLVDMTLKDKAGNIAYVSDGDVNGNDKLQVFASSYLSDNPTYTILAPCEQYSITGPAAISVSDENMSIDITAQDNVPISFSEDLHTVTIFGAEGTPFSLSYTTYDNVYDVMTISGVSSGVVTFSLSDDYKTIDVSGARTLTAKAAVSGAVSEVCTEPTGENISIQCVEMDNATGISVFSGETELSDPVSLAEREQTAVPVFDLPGGMYTEGQLLTFTKEDDVLIYYTLDGSEPTKENGILYCLPVDVNKSMTVKAIAVKYGYEDSDIVTMEYTLPQVVAPASNYEEGSYDTVLYVDLYSDDSDAEILFTTDGSDPLVNGMKFGSSITVIEDTCITACAIKDNCVSETVSYHYQVAPKERFLLINAPVNQDGEPVTADNISSTETVTLNVLSPSGTEQAGHFGIAFYDGDGNLITFEEQDETIPVEGGSILFQISQEAAAAESMEVYIDEYMAVIGNGYGTGHYAAGDSVTATAFVSEEVYFDKWTGCETLSMLHGNESSKIITFTMPASNVSLTAEVRPYHEDPVFGEPDFILPESLNIIEEAAFEGITAAAVYIPDSCIRIGRNAFSNSEITRIRIPEACELEEDIFEGCGNVYIYSTKGSAAENYCSSHDNCLFVEYDG